MPTMVFRLNADALLLKCDHVQCYDADGPYTIKTLSLVVSIKTTWSGQYEGHQGESRQRFSNLYLQYIFFIV